MRIVVRSLAVLLVLLLIGAAAVYLLSENRRDRLYTAPVAALALPTSNDAVARGAYLSSILGCRDCHGSDLGGRLMADAPPFRIEPPNLTTGEGGVGAHYDAEAWEHAIRHGIAPGGRGLYIMPSSAYRNLSDADMAALVAYLESLPPVDGHHAGLTFKPMGRALVAFGLFRPEVVTEAISVTNVPAPGADAAYGRYLASITCAHCHGATLEGGPNPEPGGAPVPSLRAAAHWTRAQFARTVQEGFTPDERRIDPQQMPWTTFSAMTDTDVTALYNYIRELEGLEAAGMPGQAGAE